MKFGNEEVDEITGSIVQIEIDDAVALTKLRKPTNGGAYIVCEDGVTFSFPRSVYSSMDEWESTVQSAIKFCKVLCVVFIGEYNIRLLDGTVKDAFCVRMEYADRYVTGIAAMTKKKIYAFDWSTETK